MASRRIEEQLELLSQLRGGGAEQAAPALQRALHDRVNLVVAKAAALAAELSATALLPELLAAFDRLFADAAKSDPQCWGKVALAKALRDLGYQDSRPFLRGAIHIQMEKVWGGEADTAGPLRGICLLALPACPDLPRERVLRYMVDALTEEAAPVRSDAARALIEMQGDDCALLLRLKARAGDADASVTGQVLEALLALERREALPFVQQFLKPALGEVAEEAALAVGASRTAEGAALLLACWPDARGQEYRQALLRALSISRQDEAISFLKKLAAEGRPQDAADARAALALFPEK